MKLNICLLMVASVLAHVSTACAHDEQDANHVNVSGDHFLLSSVVSEPFKFRNGASHFLVIDGKKLLPEGKLDTESAAWRQIHTATTAIRKMRGLNRLLHIQFFFEDGSAHSKTFQFVKRQTKTALADIDIYISCIDGHYRIDELTWAKYAASEKSKWRGE